MSKWSAKYRDSLPDSAFMYVAPGGKKRGRRTHPLSKRKLPYRNHLGSVSISHVDNALARLDQTRGIPANRRAMIRNQLETLRQGWHEGDRHRATEDVIYHREPHPPWKHRRRNPLYEVPVATKHRWTVLGWNGRSWYLWGPNGAGELYATKDEAKRDIIDGGADLRYDKLAIVPVDVPAKPPR